MLTPKPLRFGRCPGLSLLTVVALHACGAGPVSTNSLPGAGASGAVKAETGTPPAVTESINTASNSLASDALTNNALTINALTINTQTINTPTSAAPATGTPAPTSTTGTAPTGSTAAVAATPRVNHLGRVLPDMPSFQSPVMFNTPEADAILTSMQIMPKSSAWNEDISQRPVHADSAAMIARIGATQSLRFNQDMGFILVPPGQAKVALSLGIYAAESDPGPYPIPDNAPIENWPLDGTTLAATQATGTGDRHSLMVDAVNGTLYETGETYKTTTGWSASVGAIFDLNTNAMRPLTWTSADAAGLPIFPAVVRFDELERGIVEHAMRFTVSSTRKAFIYPASHYASSQTDPLLPAMGQRFRLKSTADLTGLSPHALAIAKGLQKFGMIVADNGGNWRISVAPDARITGLSDLAKFKGSHFEVIQTTGELEGPRAP